jgi:peroxiredoxin
VLVGVIVAVALMIGAAVVVSRRNGGPSAPGSSLKGDVKGSLAPDFELASLDGKQLKLSDLRGKAVLLNFWATWCEPCKIEMPWFEDLHKKYAGDGLEVVGVAMDDSGDDSIRKFVKEMGVTYTVLIGKERVGEAYGGVQFLPTTFYIDRNGKVVDRVFGIVSRKEIEDNIKKTLAVK